MTKRGKVLRDPRAGPGLLMVEGQQYLFALSDVWKSEAPPTPGLVVDVELDGVGKIQGITVVPKSQLAKEQAEVELATAREKGGLLASPMMSRLVVPDVIATGVLAAAWWFLTAVSIQVPFLGKVELTFWEVLGFVNGANVLEWLDRSSSPNAGLYGVFAMVALAGPFVRYFWKDNRAVLAAMLPLIFMIIIGIVSRSNIAHAMGGSVATAGTYASGAQPARDQSMRAFSLGLGSYVAILASLYFAVASLKRFSVSKATARQQLQPTVAKAA